MDQLPQLEHLDLVNCPRILTSSCLQDLVCQNLHLQIKAAFIILSENMLCASVVEPEPALFGRSRCEGPAPGFGSTSTLDKTEEILNDIFSIGARVGACEKKTRSRSRPKTDRLHNTALHCTGYQALNL